jgi:hypothetical protein
MPKVKVIRRRVVLDSRALRPSWERVGQYMYYFGQLELALSDLLHRSLQLSKRSAQFLLPRVMYSAKLDIIDAIIPMLKQPDGWKSQAKKTVGDCRKFADERNMFCHGAFSRQMDGTPRFDYLNMKGKPPAVASWSDGLFDNDVSSLSSLSMRLARCIRAFVP